MDRPAGSASKALLSPAGGKGWTLQIPPLRHIHRLPAPSRMGECECHKVWGWVLCAHSCIVYASLFVCVCVCVCALAVGQKKHFVNRLSILLPSLFCKNCPFLFKCHSRRASYPSPFSKRTRFSSLFLLVPAESSHSGAPMFQSSCLQGDCPLK